MSNQISNMRANDYYDHGRTIVYSSSIKKSVNGETISVSSQESVTSAACGSNSSIHDARSGDSRIIKLYYAKRSTAMMPVVGN